MWICGLSEGGREDRSNYLCTSAQPTNRWILSLFQDVLQEDSLLAYFCAESPLTLITHHSFDQWWSSLCRIQIDIKFKIGKKNKGSGWFIVSCVNYTYFAGTLKPHWDIFMVILYTKNRDNHFKCIFLITTASRTIVYAYSLQLC